MTHAPVDKSRLFYLYRLSVHDDYLFPVNFVNEDYLPDLFEEWRKGPEGLPDLIRLVRCQKFGSLRFSDVRIGKNDLGFELPDIFSIGVQPLVNQKALDAFEAAFPNGSLSHPISVLRPDGRPYITEPYFYFIPKYDFRFEFVPRPRSAETNFNPTEVDGVGALATSTATYEYVTRYPFWTHSGIERGFLMRPDVLQKLRAAGFTGLDSYTRQNGAGKFWESIGFMRLD